MASTTSARKSRAIAMTAASLAALAFPGFAAAHPSGLARPSANAAPGTIVTVKGSCVAEKQAFAASADTQSTASENPTNLVGATLKPTITKGCLVVDFSADSFAQNDNIVYAWVLLDGTPMTPGQINLSGNDDPANTGAWARGNRDITGSAHHSGAVLQSGQRPPSFDRRVQSSRALRLMRAVGAKPEPPASEHFSRALSAGSAQIQAEGQGMISSDEICG